jgi:hypothetical protein
VLRAERDEAVLLATGRMGERAEWSIGEALIGVNYRVSGKQAAYVYAMAEKRAKDRVILKLVELHGLVYSEEEADEFKEHRPAYAEGPGRGGAAEGEVRKAAPAAPKADAKAPAEDAADGSPEADLKQRITKAKTHQRGHRPDAARRHPEDAGRNARGRARRDPRLRQGAPRGARLAHPEGRLIPRRGSRPSPGPLAREARPELAFEGACPHPETP